MAKNRLEFIINIFFFSIIAALFYVALKYLLPLFLPFLTALAIAAILQRPISLLTGRFRKINPQIISAAVICISLATIGTTAFLLIGALFRELADFASDIPALLSSAAEGLLSGGTAENIISALPPKLEAHAQELYERLSNDIPGFLLTVAENLFAPLINSVGAIGSFAMKLPSLIIILLITIIMIFFIGTDYRSTVSALTEFIPHGVRKKLGHIRSCSTDTVMSLLKTYAFLMLLTFTELSVGFALFNLLGAGIAHVIPLAFITALVDILPVLGVGTVLIPWAAFDFLSGNISRAIMLAILYIIIIIIRNFLEPKLVGQRFGLHPAITLTAIYIGGKLFGFIGVFLLPLIIIIVKRFKDAGAFGEQAII